MIDWLRDGVIGLVMLGIGGTVGWFVSLEHEVTSIQVTMAQTYSTKEDLSNIAAYLGLRLDKIENMLRNRDN